MKEGGVILISIPGLKEEFSGRSRELLSVWLGKEAYMFKSRKHWKELIGSHDRIESVVTWEMACFEEAWNEWFAMDNKYAQSDKEYFEQLLSLILASLVYM